MLVSSLLFLEKFISSNDIDIGNCKEVMMHSWGALTFLLYGSDGMCTRFLYRTPDYGCIFLPRGPGVL